MLASNSERNEAMKPYSWSLKFKIEGDDKNMYSRFSLNEHCFWLVEQKEEQYMIYAVEIFFN